MGLGKKIYFLERKIICFIKQLDYFHVVFLQTQEPLSVGLK